MLKQDAHTKTHEKAAQAEPPFPRATAPQPKKKAVFQPKPVKPVKDDFLAKLRLHRKRYGW